MTFGPIVEKIAGLPEEYLPRLDKYVDKLLKEADKAWNDAIDEGLAEVAAGKVTPQTLEEHLREIDRVCA